MKSTHARHPSSYPIENVQEGFWPPKFPIFYNGKGVGWRAWVNITWSSPDFRAIICDGNGHISPARKTRFGFDHTLLSTNWSASVSRHQKGVEHYMYITCTLHEPILWMPYQPRFDIQDVVLETSAQTLYFCNSWSFLFLFLCLKLSLFSCSYPFDV